MTVEPIRDKKKIDALLMYLKGKNERDWLLAKFQLNTGLRISDVVGVKVSDLFMEKMKFRDYFSTVETKTHKAKKIMINEELKKALKEYISTKGLGWDDYIFGSRKLGGHITPTQAYRVLVAGAEAVAIENFGTHSLRKTWGFWTYKASRYNIGLIMDIFNHSTQKVTLRYIGISQEAKDELYSMVQF